MFWGIIWALVSLTLSATYSPSWQTSPYFQCSSVALITTNTSAADQSTYFSSFTQLAVGRPSAFIGILNWEMSNGTDSQVSISVLASSVSNTQFRIRTQLSLQTSLSSLIVGLLLLDDASFSSVKVNRISSSPIFVNVSTGSGNRFDITSVTMAALNLSHANYMIPCINSLVMKANGSDFLSLKVTLQIKNQTSYYSNVSTSGNNIVSSVIYSRIQYDQTQIQLSKYHFLDVKFFIANNNVIAQNVSFIYSQPNNFVAGLNAYNFSLNQIIQFNFSTDTFAFTNKYQYNHINITCWNYRFRECPSGFPYYLEKDNLCYDVCPAKSYTNEADLYCEPCHGSCLTCNDSTSSSCLSCDNTRNLNSTNYCNCKSTTSYDAVNYTCTQCVPSCITCSSATVCLSCNITGNMVLNGTTCDCVAGAFLVLPAKTYCVLCSTISPGCTACSETACTVCNTSINFIRNGSVCQCVSNYYLNSSNLCQSCPSLPNCVVCKNATYCSECTSAFQPVNGVCQCKSIYKFLNSSSLCQDCQVPCETCSSLSYCLSCSDKSKTLLNGVCCSSILFDPDTSKPCTMNICPVGFENSTGICKEICGDGILFTLECDDGNLLNGDGCNSECRVETNYTCVNGSSTSPSLCSYNQPLDLTLTSSSKQISANTVVFQISVGPALKVLDTFDFSDIISTNVPNSETSFKYKNGVLTVSVSYSQTLQEKNITLLLSPPTSYNNTFDMKLSHSKFVIYPENLPAYYYEPSVYQESKALDVILIVASAIGMFLCLTMTRKMIGLELMSVIQMSFFTLTLTSTLHPIFSIWGQHGHISSGFNILPPNLNQLFTDYKVPTNILYIQYHGNYLQNLNWMFVIELGVFIVGLLLLLIGKFTIRLIFQAGIFMLKDVMMTFVFFNTLNGAFSAGLQVHFMTMNQFTEGETACNFVAIALSLGFNCIVLYLYFKHTEMYRDELIILKMNRASTIHPLVFCIYRLVIGFLMGILNHLSYTVLIVLGLEVCYMIFVAVNHPHKNTYQFVRGMLNEGSIIFHLITLIVYEKVLTSLYTSNNHAATALAWIDVLVILGATIFSCYCMGYSIWKERSVSNGIENTHSTTLQNLRTKDLIHEEEVKSREGSDMGEVNLGSKIFSTDSKRKIMDPEEESPNKESVTRDDQP